MSYLDELKKELRALLDGVDTEQQETIIKWVLKKVYQSWKNGKEYTKTKAQIEDAENKIKKGKQAVCEERGEGLNRVLMRCSAEGGNALRPFSPHVLTNHTGL